MKPSISVILVSHKKPNFCATAVNSVMTQTLPFWELHIIDSGPLVGTGYFDQWQRDPRVIVSQSNEAPDLATRVNPHSFIVNRLLNSGRDIDGELIVFLCDDDLFYPWAFQAMWGFFQDAPGRDCMHGAIHLGRTDEYGVTTCFGSRSAIQARGRSCGGGKLDCEVDYLQFVFSQKALADYRAKFGNEILSERLEDKGHADGIFMERMGELHPVYAIPSILGMNRRTPFSAFAGT